MQAFKTDGRITILGSRTGAWKNYMSEQVILGDIQLGARELGRGAPRTLYRTPLQKTDTLLLLLLFLLYDHWIPLLVRKARIPQIELQVSKHSYR